MYKNIHTTSVSELQLVTQQCFYEILFLKVFQTIGSTDQNWYDSKTKADNGKLLQQILVLEYVDKLKQRCGDVEHFENKQLPKPLLYEIAQNLIRLLLKSHFTYPLGKSPAKDDLPEDPERDLLERICECLFDVKVVTKTSEYWENIANNTSEDIYLELLFNILKSKNQINLKVVLPEIIVGAVLDYATFINKSDSLENAQLHSLIGEMDASNITVDAVTDKICTLLGTLNIIWLGKKWIFYPIANTIGNILIKNNITIEEKELLNYFKDEANYHEYIKSFIDIITNEQELLLAFGIDIVFNEEIPNTDSVFGFRIVEKDSISKEFAKFPVELFKGKYIAIFDKVKSLGVDQAKTKCKEKISQFFDTVIFSMGEKLEYEVELNNYCVSSNEGLEWSVYGRREKYPRVSISNNSFNEIFKNLLGILNNDNRGICYTWLRSLSMYRKGIESNSEIDKYIFLWLGLETLGCSAEGKDLASSLTTIITYYDNDPKYKVKWAEQLNIIQKRILHLIVIRSNYIIHNQKNEALSETSISILNELLSNMLRKALYISGLAINKDKTINKIEDIRIKIEQNNLVL
ncbi:MAG: hypothetical protein LHV68_05200 [Elusimicrobia bacterium]|nr:hypothetical protein [Candidatus Liberimonas magnetica]